MEVLPKDFEIGKVYKGHKHTTWVRLDEDRLFQLGSGSIEIKSPTSEFVETYSEISLDDLSLSQLDLYHKNFPPWPSQEEAKEDTCTCSITDIMAYGCKCGAFQREQAKKK